MFLILVEVDKALSKTYFLRDTSCLFDRYVEWAVYEYFFTLVVQSLSKAFSFRAASWHFDRSDAGAVCKCFLILVIGFSNGFTRIFGENEQSSSRQKYCFTDLIHFYTEKSLYLQSTQSSWRQKYQK
jgi:hypothetical protein